MQNHSDGFEGIYYFKQWQKIFITCSGRKMFVLHIKKKDLRQKTYLR